MNTTAAHRTADLPLTEVQLEIERAADRLTGRIRHCARSAFVHLRKAWKLHGVDDEMSAFRAITGEEEAATALIQALKRQRYPGSERLKPWNHVDKNAFWPVVSAVSDTLYKSGMQAPILRLSTTGQPRVTLHLDINKLAGGEGEPVWAEPDEPLNFALRTGEASNAVIEFFEAELAELAGMSGEKSILGHIKTVANLRNRLLYASDDGIPNITFNDSFLLERAKRVCVLVMLTIMVTQTSMHQLFVVQCLNAMLRALEIAKVGLPDLEDFEPATELPVISIYRTADMPAQITIRRRIDVTVSWGGLIPRWKWKPLPRPSVTYGMD